MINTVRCDSFKLHSELNHHRASFNLYEVDTIGYDKYGTCANTLQKLATLANDCFLVWESLVVPLPDGPLIPTCLPDEGGVSLLLPTEHGLMPGTKQMTDLLTLRVIHISVDFVLLGAPVTSLSEEGGTV